jgi:hypothetical protein
MNVLAPEAIDVLVLPSLPLERRSHLPTTAAIYFVLDALNRVQYIGRATNLKMRWRGHHRVVELSHMLEARIAYLTVSDATLLPDIERALIEYFEPPCNRHCQFVTYINLKTTFAHRNHLLGKLRARGTTLRAFLADVIELLATDEELFDFVEERHIALGRARARNLGPLGETRCADVALTP